MTQNSIVKVKTLISEIVTNRWSDTKIKDKGDSLVYNIQHKFEKVSYSAKFEIEDDVLNIAFRSKPYDKDMFEVDSDYIDLLRFDFFRTARVGVTGVSMEFEDIKDSDAVIPVILL